jgi:hypothetical protein
MENKLRESSCESCGPIRHDELCRSLDRPPSVRSRSGRILRHWTTNDLVFMGKATTTAEKGDWGLADARRRNLIASKLKLFASGAGAP